MYISFLQLAAHWYRDCESVMCFDERKSDARTVVHGVGAALGTVSRMGGGKSLKTDFGRWTETWPDERFGQGSAERCHRSFAALAQEPPPRRNRACGGVAYQSAHPLGGTVADGGLTYLWICAVGCRPKGLVQCVATLRSMYVSCVDL
jgi:hypothetical protein